MGRNPRQFERVILVCTGSKCKKAGAKEIAKDLRNCAKQLGLKKSTHVVRMRCNGMCSRCPIVSLQPQNVWLTSATVSSARRAFLDSYAKNVRWIAP